MQIINILLFHSRLHFGFFVLLFFNQKNIHVYVSSLLVITISIIMVDRSYIFMLIVSLFMRLKTFNIYKFIFYSLIILIIFSTWKVFFIPLYFWK